MPIKEPTREEVIQDLVDFINCDLTTVIQPHKIKCPDCDGHGLLTSQLTYHRSTCATCSGTGELQTEDFDINQVPMALRRQVTGFKQGKNGRMILEFRSKDKAIALLAALVGNVDDVGEGGYD